MSLLPRRLRAGHSGHVAVHPGWTLSPPTADPSSATAVEPAGTDLPASRWTSSPALPPLPVPAPLPVPPPVPAAQTLSAWVEAPAAPIATVLSAPLPLVVPDEEWLDLPTRDQQPVREPAALTQPEPAAEASSWTTEWEAVAATPLTPAGPTALHTAAAAALDAVFGRPAELPAPPALREPAPASPLTAPASPLTALDLPLPDGLAAADTPLAAQAVAFLQSAVPARPVMVPPVAQQLVERAVRTAPAAPQLRRSTVRLGFTDASVIDLRPDDPMAKALHTVADALIGRDPV